MIREEQIQIPFVYAAGSAASRFLEVLRDEKRIIGSYCDKCDHVAVPARTFCPLCTLADLTEIEVGPEGSLIAWTELPQQGSYALVRLDGADSAMLHRFIGPVQALATGIRVRARFADTRTGSIHDLQGFEVIGGSE